MQGDLNHSKLGGAATPPGKPAEPAKTTEW
jgi:hypothetical protein